MREYKILFTGTMGAGKTTAIAAISDVAPVSTDVQNNDPSLDKARTTVGLDYGEVVLGPDERLRLYGTPGQARFSFMWGILSRGALGLVILIDNSRPDPLGDLRIYLDGFAECIAVAPCVIGVGRLPGHPHPGLDDYAAALAQAGHTFPVVEVDVREAQQVRMLLDLLLLQLECTVA
ncbi:signal recognition particle receptor subunit beta [Pseudomonas nitritireducens]|uniref:Signal recognition particle receptor subunit beta n=1 Tax=Pseudomonas nitroreducens TaxID=46680 RepID=A0A7W7P4H4_PSENT|nr:GTP-binding protein [Pseudomonas nitritireducens]MBB4867726.1 signal recognition particle receptor subunit beta [Pseudomonas nitritireducens]